MFVPNGNTNVTIGMTLVSVVTAEEDTEALAALGARKPKYDGLRVRGFLHREALAEARKP